MRTAVEDPVSPAESLTNTLTVKVPVTAGTHFRPLAFFETHPEGRPNQAYVYGGTPIATLAFRSAESPRAIVGGVAFREMCKPETDLPLTQRPILSGGITHPEDAPRPRG